MWMSIWWNGTYRGKKSTCDNPVPMPLSPPQIQHGQDGWSKHCLVYSTHSGHVIL